jgi:hypothetical protein
MVLRQGGRWGTSPLLNQKLGALAIHGYGDHIKDEFGGIYKLLPENLKKETTGGI